MSAAPQQRSRHGRAALAFWLLIFLIITGDSVVHLYKHDTTPVYLYASRQWWQGQDPYTYNTHASFLYFPQAAIIFTPFTWGPPALGEILWRTAVFGLFAYALTRLAQFFLCNGQRPAARTFLVLSLLAVPSSMASLRNAQFDLPLAALVVLMTAEIATERWKAAAVWLCLAVALKPLAIVPLLLFGALYWKLIPRAAVGLLIVLAVPFLNWNPGFAAHEYVRCFETMRWSAHAGEPQYSLHCFETEVFVTPGDAPRFSDLASLLAHFGLYPPDALKLAARFLFGLVYLRLGYAAVRHLGRIEAAWTIGALSADYLMLFNPRTETCSYVFLGPFVASLAMLYARQPSRKYLSRVLGTSAVLLASDAFPRITPVLDFRLLTDLWLKPLIALFFLFVLIQFIYERRSPSNRAAAGTPASSAAV